MSKLNDIFRQLNTLSADEQKTVQKFLAEQEADRRNRRKKELWGNVVAAIRKYEREVETITIELPSEDCDASPCDMDTPGIIVVQYD